MPSVELDDADRAALIALLKRTIAADPFPMSARTTLLRGILAKLQSSSARQEATPERQSAAPAKDERG